MASATRALMNINRLVVMAASHLVVLAAACSSSGGGGNPSRNGGSSSVQGSVDSRSAGQGGTANGGASSGGSTGATSRSVQGGSSAESTSATFASSASAGASSTVASSGGAPATGGAGGTSSLLGGTGPGGQSGSGGATSAGGSSHIAVDAGASVDGATSGTCSPSASILAKGDSRRTLKVGEQSRSYLLHVPSSYTGKSPVPFVIDFHGMGDTPDKQRGMSGFLALSDSEGFLIAWPEGIDKAWNFGPCCTCSKTVDDLGFAKAMVNEVASLACLDLKRVYANGFSIGGAMTHYLACNGADVFAAATPSAADLLGSGQLPCHPSRPISVLAFRGTADTTVPYDGLKGSTPNSCPAVLDMLGAEASLAQWASINSCTGSPTFVNVTDGTQRIYTQCAGGVEVGLYTMQSAGHTPGPAKAAWAFLKTKSLP